MKITTALNKQQKLSMRLGDLFSKGAIYSMKATDMWAEEREIIFGDKSLPRWVRSYLEGQAAVHRANLYRYKLEFCYVLDGKILSVNRDSERYYEKLGYEVGQLTKAPRGHYWIGKNRPYSDISAD